MKEITDTDRLNAIDYGIWIAQDCQLVDGNWQIKWHGGFNDICVEANTIREVIDAVILARQKLAN